MSLKTASDAISKFYLNHVTFIVDVIIGLISIGIYFLFRKYYIKGMEKYYDLRKKQLEATHVTNSDNKDTKHE